MSEQDCKQLCKIVQDQSAEIYKTVLEFGEYVNDNNPQIDHKKLKKTKHNLNKSIGLINTIMARKGESK